MTARCGMVSPMQPEHPHGQAADVSVNELTTLAPAPPRHVLRAAALVAALACAIAGCEKDSPPLPPQEPPPKPRFVPPADSELPLLLGLDAGDFVPPDPPPPAGDLRAEADSFKDLDSCVRQRATLDPVVGDAVDALGYETFLRDACRVIEAVKTRSTAPCEAITATSLRERCATSVAVVLGDSQTCPMVGQSHDALCVALARRDARLCASVGADRKATCRAMLARDKKKCGADARCGRMVERWKGLLPETSDKPELGTKVTVELTAIVDGGKQKATRVDLSSHVNPAMVVKMAGSTRILIGEVVSAPWPPFQVATEPRVSMVLMASPENVKQGIHALGAEQLGFELLIPKTASLSSKAQRSPAAVTIDMVGTDIGSPVRFNVEADVGEEGSSWHVSLKVNTYVRDVVTR